MNGRREPAVDLARIALAVRDWDCPLVLGLHAGAHGAIATTTTTTTAHGRLVGLHLRREVLVVGV